MTDRTCAYPGCPERPDPARYCAPHRARLQECLFAPRFYEAARAKGFDVAALVRAAEDQRAADDAAATWRRPR